MKIQKTAEGGLLYLKLSSSFNNSDIIELIKEEHLQIILKTRSNSILDFNITQK